ncbi:MAG TPA: tRNA (adenosine(37)-N6)-threonylcarbamoyltransferase complex ATPase subunit type 1 TsaE, partial [Clostridiales bacterium]|nr:tRNA (adenosine(37)-N6)-threonylcarbamoyltransferase complex ATPase subunit type 1 TsaE [Clostridiales bacterium]
VGKTAFARGFCRALGIFSVKSPTYTVVNEYAGGKLPVFHFDMYRLADEDDLLSVGYEEYLARDGYLLAEWSERAGDMLPPDRITVTICRTDNATGREITLSFPDALAEQIGLIQV